MEKFMGALPGLDTVEIKDAFWGRIIKLVRENVVPYQWEALNDRIPDAAKSHCIENFRIAAGRAEGEFYGCVFQDSDLGKWLEAAAYLLSQKRDPELEKICDEAIELMGAAQGKDGYLNTYFTVKAPEARWTNLRDWHELYCAGHLMEGAVAYYEATGKRTYLDIMCRYADYIDSVFGPEPEKKHGYPGHEEVELALVKLYRVTGVKRYLDLAAYFINQRGTQPHYFDVEGEKRDPDYHENLKKGTERDGWDYRYNQSHKPVREQKDIVGHSVRAMYLCTGMAEVARETGDESLKEACRTLFDSTASRNMYITGSIGSNAHYERFSLDYHLPNDTVYGETCAAIGLVFFARSMLTIEKKSVYADVMERCLYNGVISGMSLDGKSFFYVNPLEVWPEEIREVNHFRHVNLPRQKWFGCACCPPNLARLAASLGKYTYDYDGDSLYMHLYVGGTLENGPVKIETETNLPWDGRVRMKVASSGKKLDLALRIPGWCFGKYTLLVNGIPAEAEVRDGYAHIERVWQEGDEVVLDLDMSVRVIRSNPLLRADIGKAALTRGPVVYCMEEADNGKNLPLFLLDEDAPVEYDFEPELLEGVGVLTAQGVCLSPKGSALYTDQKPGEAPATAKFVPYYAWDNRGVGEMTVWVHTR